MNILLRFSFYKAKRRGQKAAKLFVKECKYQAEKRQEENKLKKEK